GYERLVAIGKPILEGSSQGQKRSTTQILTLSDPKIKGQEPKTLSKRAHNPPVERGWADKADSRPPLRGPGGRGSDWYVWHAPDGLRARAATRLGCMQAGAGKLGVIEASYASAIIGVLSPNTVELAVRYVRNRASNYSPLTKGGNTVRHSFCSLPLPAHPKTSCKSDMFN